MDLLQLARAIQAGIDLDGDGSPDLDPNRIHYHGFSYGGNLGTVFMAVEPSVATGVLSVAGGAQMDMTRWSPVVRPAFGWPIFADRTPALSPNLGDQFEEDYVLRDQPVKVTRVAGALELQNLYEAVGWIYAPGDQLSYASHLRASTLPGVPIKRVLFQMAKGDQTVPNPTASALVRAANMRE